MSWVSIPKPSVASYTPVTFQGRQIYDDASVSFDDANTYYDSLNVNQWTSVAKPTSSVWTQVAKPS